MDFKTHELSHIKMLCPMDRRSSPKASIAAMSLFIGLVKLLVILRRFVEVDVDRADLRVNALLLFRSLYYFYDLVSYL